MNLLCRTMAHRGEILEKYIRTEKVNMTKLANKLPWTVKTVYRHFLEEDLALEKLQEYARALKYDFKKEIPELEAVKNLMTEPYPSYKQPSGDTNTEDFYRNKYEDVLEKYTELLVKYNALLEGQIGK